ncbi:hypothetical protein U1Q18_028946 [Sarracenia purpurea var. burkii]
MRLSLILALLPSGALLYFATILSLEFVANSSILSICVWDGWTLSLCSGLLLKEHSSLCYLSCYSFGCWSFTGGLIGMSEHVSVIVLLGVFLVAAIIFLVAARSEHVGAYYCYSFGSWSLDLDVAARI